jgi:hypothetical protein
MSVDTRVRGVSNPLMRTAAVALLSLALAAWGAAARAQDVGPAAAAPEDDVRARADAMIDAGVELRKEGREHEALERFRAAHALSPSPRALGQMGLAAKSIRLYVEAEGYLLRALAVPDDPWVQKNREALELAREVTGKQLASLIVLSNVAGAELFVNGKPAGRLPLETPVRTLAGAARVELRAHGHAPVSTEATLPSGQTATLQLHLAALLPPRPAIAPLPLQAAPAVQARPSRLPWIVVSAGVGAIGVGVGTYFGVRTLSLKNERDEVCPPNDQATCPTRRGTTLDGQARDAALGSTVAFTLGAVGLATAGVLLLLEPRADRRARASLSLDPRGGLAGASLRY